MLASEPAWSGPLAWPGGMVYAAAIALAISCGHLVHRPMHPPFVPARRRFKNTHGRGHHGRQGVSGGTATVAMDWHVQVSLTLAATPIQSSWWKRQRVLHRHIFPWSGTDAQGLSASRFKAVQSRWSSGCCTLIATKLHAYTKCWDSEHEVLLQG
jgi:hypothetical protein